MHHVAAVAGATHVVFAGLFFELGAAFLGWVNVGSVLMFALSYLCLRRRWNVAAVVLILSEILLHAILAVRAIGWDSGFHYYLILVAPIVYVSRTGALPKAALVGTVFLCHLLLDHAMKATAPLYLLEPHTLTGLRYFNVAVSFLLLSYLSGHYYGLIKDSERKLRELATTDPLTRLLNRRSWLELAEYELVKRRRQPEPLALVLADIDHFKVINDTHGHLAGDAVLQAVSEVLRQSVRQQDSVARWGGEEFMVLMPQATPETARLVAERLREKIGQLRVPLDSGESLAVSMTFGVSGHQAEEAIEAPMRRADAALYQGKAAGRNQVVLAAA